MAESATRTPEQIHRERLDDAWTWLMEQPKFRLVLFEVVDSPAWCARSASTYDTNGSRMTLAEGRRQIGIQLSNEAQRIAPQMYLRGLYEVMNLRRELEVAARKQETTKENE